MIVAKVLDPMIASMVKDSAVDIKQTPLKEYSEGFLLDAGMTESALNTLKDKLFSGSRS